MTTSADVPARFDVGLNGRAYMIDWAMKDRLSGPTSLRVARSQADTANKAGEQSLARENLWRRVVTSWHHGAGQLVYDDETSDPYRFYKSLGVDIWTPGRVKPLASVARKSVPNGNAGHISGGNVMLLYTGLPYVVGSGGTSLYYAYDATGPVTTAANILSACTDGQTIYLACAGAGTLGGGLIYTNSTGTGAAAAYTAGTTYYLVRYALGRLWGASDTGLYNITGAATFNLAVNKSTTARWTDVVAGQGGVLASVTDGFDSSIYFVGLLPDGSGVSGGYAVADLPRGEVVYAMHSYLGYIILGTNKGVRVCKHQGGSNFTIGPLLDLFSDVGQSASPGTLTAPDTTGVRCFASSGRWVYFGWSFYYWTGQDTASGTSGSFYAGLGRLDLSTFVDQLQPAYASDVMVLIGNTDGHTTGEVMGCVVDKWGTPSFVVANDECYTGSVQGTPGKSRLGAGTVNNFLYQGRITHGINDAKVVSRAKARHDTISSTNTITFGFQVEAGGSALLGGSVTSTVGTAETAITTFSPSTLPSVQPNITWAAETSYAAGAYLYDLTIEAWPSPPRLERWQLPLLLHKTVETKDRGTYTYDSLTTELDALRSLAASSGRQVIQFQFLGQTYNAVVDDYEFVPYGPAPVVGDEYQGTVVLTISRSVS